MDSYPIHTSLIGTLEVSVSDGLYQHCEFELGGHTQLIALYIVEDFLTKEHVGTVQHLIDQIPTMYQKAKNHITNSASSNEIMEQYATFHIEELAEDLLSLLELNSIDELTPEIFMNVLEPRSIRIGPNNKGAIECSFDYSLPEDYSDELLVVSFDSNLEIYHVTQES